MISVSPAYPRELADRYPWFAEGHATVLPFGAPEADFEALRRRRITNPIYDPEDGLVHWVYVGRAGGDMAYTLTGLFGALATAREADPETNGRDRLHDVGTS